jgi:hypothetical protein
MKLPRRRFLHLAAGAAALPAVSRLANAQSYPSRPVRIIAPTAPGGAPDILTGEPTTTSRNTLRRRGYGEGLGSNLRSNPALSGTYALWAVRAGRSMRSAL